MPRLPGISQKEAVRVFQKLGYRVVRESGHLILSNGERRLVIPRHDPINAITMGAIARDAGLSPQQFRELLQGSLTAEGLQLSPGQKREMFRVLTEKPA